jgi:hypothetical protein
MPEENHNNYEVRIASALSEIQNRNNLHYHNSNLLGASIIKLGTTSFITLYY